MAPLTNMAALLLGAVAGAEAAQDWDHSLYTTSPPVYPSPNMTGVDSASLSGWAGALEKAEALLSNLTLEEKVLMLTGAAGPCVGNIAPIPRVGFKGLCLQDGPLGIRQADYASAFPAGLSAAASFDKDLIHERGKLIGEEFRGKGAHIFLGPVAGPLGRSAMAGRNWEGFSPDPYLTGVAMEETILGVQSTGVQANAKHWVAYEQETQRNPEDAFAASHEPNDKEQMSVSSNVDDRTLHELYVWPFANAIRAGVSSVMCAYQRINGSYACQNSKTQNGILKTELGFQGYVMSDWMGTHSGVASVEAGLDMTMPGAWNWQPWLNWSTPSYFGGNLTKAVENGTVSVTRVDDMVKRVLTPYYLLGQDEGFPGVDPSSGAYPAVNDFQPESNWYDTWKAAGALNDEVSVNVRGNHSEHIRKLGAAGSVLLKNVNNTLPLKSPKKIAVFGNAAGDLTNGLYPKSSDYEYGTLPVGGGSGTSRFTSVVAPLDAIKTRAKADGATVQYVLNNTLLTTAGSYASKIYPEPDVCLVFVKTWASEGEDRADLNLNWEGNEVIDQIAANCSNTVVISNSGGLTLMPWANHENVTAILAAHLPGEEIGNSIVDILYGDVNPSGKLPYTIAHQASDYYFANITTSVANTTDTDAWQSDFTERLLIDYRYFDYHNISVLYEFGFGLSYTTFALADISISPVSNSSTIAGTPAPTTEVVPGGNPALWDTVYKVTATVSNTGDLTGAAVPQLYIELPASAGEGTPVKQLRGFEKVELAAGESQQVTFELMRRDLSVWDVVSQEWSVPSGTFGVHVGFSSRDVQLKGQFTV
ncbi:Glycoside hydrolase family 3 [Macrophomina phaseolina MS6]|uniref:Probable beta-glucosidase G n=2 Tax=Macrophomina phaseolina TaxID=35725 RepID=K2RIE7_MACPH|nr:Glycoside hydrolase family 3 [Macrophomina phaseolina MS6]KAH7025362.1 glycoside hydrolase superfamily [Macrophomina phaseolina]